MVITLSGVRCVRLALHQLMVGTWFTYAVMQIFFGGFSGLDKPDGVDINKAGAGRVI